MLTMATAAWPSLGSANTCRWQRYARYDDDFADSANMVSLLQRWPITLPNKITMSKKIRIFLSANY